MTARTAREALVSMVKARAARVEAARRLMRTAVADWETAVDRLRNFDQLELELGPIEVKK